MPTLEGNVNPQNVNQPILLFKSQSDRQDSKPPFNFTFKFKTLIQKQNVISSRPSSSFSCSPGFASVLLHLVGSSYSASTLIMMTVTKISPVCKQGCSARLDGLVCLECCCCKCLGCQWDCHTRPRTCPDLLALQPWYSDSDDHG